MDKIIDGLVFLLSGVDTLSLVWGILLVGIDYLRITWLACVTSLLMTYLGMVEIVERIRDMTIIG